MTDRGDYYLMLPASPVDSGGLKWSAAFDAIEDGSRRTVVLFEELEAILAGVFAAHPVPPFLSVLQVLHWLRCETKYSAQFATLRDACRRNQKAESAPRHLGVLIAELCRPFSRALNPPDWTQLQLALYRLGSDGLKHQQEYAVLPTTTEDELAERIGQELQKYDAAALDHILKFGTAPTDAGDQLATEVDELPRTVEEVLALARQRSRLVGAAFFSPVLDAALTLPARGRTSESLPLGGYADVTTRGDPDRLLLSQFALDPDDFVRRFAERELLYFKREEPHAPVPPERVIVLDQGVRTWGGVRLALAAAVLTLVKQNPAKAPVPRLFVTSRDEAVSVSRHHVEDLAKALEASDFTTNPAELLARVHDEPDSETPRDILLLTHPRSAAEAAVIAAAKRSRPTDRLFVLAVNDDGASQLSEWTTRGPVPVRSFHVDLVGAENAEPEKTAAPVPLGTSFQYRPWTGDVEPVPFPFRPGLIERPAMLGFDATGEQLVATTATGIPHAIDTTSGSVEVLPRGMVDGAVLKTVNAILAVNGGVVICGTITLLNQEQTTIDILNGVGFTTSATIPSTGKNPLYTQYHVAAHYDWDSRTVRVFEFGRASDLPKWVAYPDLHSIVMLTGNERCPIALDLSTTRKGGSFVWTGRTGEARGRKYSAGTVHQVKVVTDLRVHDTKIQPCLLLINNSFRLVGPGENVWETFQPTEDGQPLLGGANIGQVELATDIVAIALKRGKAPELRLFHGPDPIALGVVPLDDRSKLFTLSPNGQKLGWMRDRRELAIAATNRLPHVLATARHAGLHNQLEVRCNAVMFQLSIVIGNFYHNFVYVNDVFSHTFSLGLSSNKKAFGTAARHRVKRKLPPGYEPDRFAVVGSTADDSLHVVVDRCGQIIVLDRSDRVVVVFLIRRDKAAAWTPDGGFWGDPELIGGPSTPNAEHAIAAAIRAAMEAS